MKKWNSFVSSWFKSRQDQQTERHLIQQAFSKLAALDRVLGVIEFSPNGHILEANSIFLQAVGYRLDEIKGQHHRLFVLPEEANSKAYTQFWGKLAQGHFDQGQYQRLSKSGQKIWLQASYNPILDAQGRVVKVVKYATVITENKQREFEFQGQMQAINKVLGVIEFSLDGHILAMNDNFSAVTGYLPQEVIGQHHRMFMPEGQAETKEYHQFWLNLAAGKFQSGIYKRVGKSGEEIWLQASYNPIFNHAGKPYKVVKYATNITEQKSKDVDVSGQLSAINKIMAVIAFDLNGNILHANSNFLNTVGYQDHEVIGQHHRLFVLPEEKESTSYRQFWESLASGHAQSGIFKRLDKHGKPIWLQASYNPILNPNGKPYKIVKYATDITEQYLRDIDNSGQIASINRSLGTIEFSLDGHVLKANDNFLQVVGYRESDIIGKHHSQFMPAEEINTAEYRAFWQQLAQGQFVQGVFKRIGKNGQEIWLQASYNPILDEQGQPFKVVKFALDITAQKNAETGLIQAVLATEKLLEAAQQGDMTARISLNGKSEQILNLSKGINALMDQMSDVLTQVKEAAKTINVAANEISSGNLDLSTRTEKQAQSLQATASSMSQLAGTVKQNAENAKQANEMAEVASDVAERGGKAVGEVVDTMLAISSSAKQIEDIISVIDGIAFQTNILALNAAVEAARAGEQGKGFAVVAGEVRNLAQRSATAAKEIKTLITESVYKTTEGTKLVEDAGNTMAEIVQSVKHVSDIISEISAASLEQTAGIDQVNQAINSMDEATQQNNALVEQAAAAAESLVEEANQLSDMVSEYVLDKSKKSSIQPTLKNNPKMQSVVNL